MLKYIIASLIFSCVAVVLAILKIRKINREIAEEQKNIWRTRKAQLIEMEHDRREQEEEKLRIAEAAFQQAAEREYEDGLRAEEIMEELERGNTKCL